MKRVGWLIMLLLCVGVASAGQQYVSISINEDTSVQQDVVLVLDRMPGANETVRYEVAQAPASVSFIGGEARINSSENGSFVELIPSTEQRTLQFSLRYGVGSLVELTGTEGRVFSQTVYADDDALTINAALPRGHSLSDRNPAASPEPEAISSDGQRIRLIWVRPRTDELAIFVSYRSANNWVYILVGAGLLSAAAFFGLRFYRKKQTREALLRALSSDERELFERVKSGVHKQKALSDELGWSKSKTSKVVRRLEERGVLEKEPYFKTNKLHITSFWKE